VDLDGEIRAKQLALHALDAIFRSGNLNQEDVHLQNIFRTELGADAAPFAVALDYLNSCTAHSGLSPFLGFVLAKATKNCGELSTKHAPVLHFILSLLRYCRDRLRGCLESVATC
jgi:hypothetical protein